VVRQITVQAALAVAVFAAVFALTNPYALIEWRRSIAQVRTEMAHASLGHVTRARDPGWRWLTVLGAPRVLGVATLLFATLGWVSVLGPTDAELSAGVSWPRRAAAWLDAPRLLALWTAAYLAYLLVAVGYQEARYALPIFPPLCVFAAGGVAWLARGRRLIAAALGAVVLATTVLLALAPLRRLAHDRLAQRLDDDRPPIAAGLWLEQRLTPAAAVLTDAYVYIPPQIAASHVTFGLTAAEVEARRPVVIVVNEVIRGRFRAPDGGARAVDGPSAYQERRMAYESIEAGRLGCYTLLRDFGGVAVYADAAALESGAQRGCGLSQIGR
jgi:hypothetical protein